MAFCLLVWERRPWEPWHLPPSSPNLTWGDAIEYTALRGTRHNSPCVTFCNLKKKHAYVCTSMWALVWAHMGCLCWGKCGGGTAKTLTRSFLLVFPKYFLVTVSQHADQKTTVKHLLCPESKKTGSSLWVLTSITWYWQWFLFPGVRLLWMGLYKFADPGPSSTALTDSVILGTTLSPWTCFLFVKWERPLRLLQTMAFCDVTPILWLKKSIRYSFISTVLVSYGLTLTCHGWNYFLITFYLVLILYIYFKFSLQGINTFTYPVFKCEQGKSST